MKCILLATVAVLAATVAQAETAYVTPGSVVPWHAKGQFKTAINGDEKLLVVHASETNQDIIIVANKPPEGTLIASADVLVLDDQGKVVDNLTVVVTPFGGPSRAVRFFGSGKTTTYLCADYCINASPTTGPRDMGDADALTVTRFRDGSTTTTKQWSSPPPP
jgi:hypothetical protein